MYGASLPTSLEQRGPGRKGTRLSVATADHTNPQGFLWRGCTVMPMCVHTIMSCYLRLAVQADAVAAVGATDVDVASLDDAD